MIPPPRSTALGPSVKGQLAATTSHRVLFYNAAVHN